MDAEEKKAVATALSIVGQAIDKDVDTRRLVVMADADFQKEVDALSSDILAEISQLKKRYYDEGFKDALRQIQAQQVSQVQQPQTPPAAQPAPQIAVVDTGVGKLEGELNTLEQKLSDFSDRVAALEQNVLNNSIRDEQLHDVITENRDLVSTLKNRLSEIAVLQSSIEEKLSQTPSALGEKIDALGAQVENATDLVIAQDSKINASERARKASVRRLDRKLKAIEERLDDFKKVRRQIRKQGKRITSLAEVSVEKGVVKRALKRVRKTVAAVKTQAPKRRKAMAKTRAKRSARTTKTTTIRTTTLVQPKTLVVKTKAVKVVRPKSKAKAPSKRKAKSVKRSAPRRTAAAKTSKISISAAAPTTVEINQKK